MGSEDASLGSSGNQKVSILLIAVASAALVVTIYHCVIICWCRRRQTVVTSRPPSLEEAVEIPSIEFSTAQLIPAHKYQKEAARGGDDTCAICLCDFEEGEELRRLPECIHSFHAACIDMWLYSHASCPMCRTDATPSPQITFPAQTYRDYATEEAGDQEMSDLLAELLLPSTEEEESSDDPRNCSSSIEEAAVLSLFQNLFPSNNQSRG